MIKKEDTLKIGQLIKPHGLQGELSFEFFTDIFDQVDAPYLICEIDGIFVPFFIESYRFKNDSHGLIKFEDIDSDEDAKELSKVNLYLSRSLIPAGFSDEEALGFESYIGYRIVDRERNPVGEIIAIDDSTDNVLFLVSSISEDELLIPVSDDYILEINDDTRIIQMDIPEGLLDLN